MNNIPQQVELHPGNGQRHWNSVRPESAGTADPVKICFRIPRDILCEWGAISFRRTLMIGLLVSSNPTISLPKSTTFLGNFCKGVKNYHFSSKIILGNFYRHLETFYWSHWLPCLIHLKSTMWSFTLPHSNHRSPFLGWFVNMFFITWPCVKYTYSLVSHTEKSWR